MSLIHPTAIIHEGAQLGPECSVGPYSIIGPHVRLGARNRIGPHVVLEGHTQIGDDNQIFQFASIGSAPQDLKYRGEPSEVKIGSRNVIREYVTIQPGTAGGGMLTSVGDRNLFMVNSHVGHDCRIGDGNVFANSMAVAGHVSIGNNTIIGGLVGIHQFTRLGDGCLLGAGSMVSNDIPPFCIAQGDRARLIGLNVIGLERRGVPAEVITRLKKLYRELFFASGTLESRVSDLRGKYADLPQALMLLDFIGESERGITIPSRRRGAAAAD